MTESARGERGVPFDAPQNVEWRQEETAQEDYGLRRGPRMTATERWFLRLLEDNPHYCTDEMEDRIVLARVLAAAAPQGRLTNFTQQGVKEIVFRSLEIHLVDMPEGEVVELGRRVAVYLWTALQARGVAP